MLRSSIIRASRSSAAVMPSVATRTALPRAAPVACQLQQTRQASHAISNPTLANIEKRWEDMPPQEQADLWMSLRDRMKVDWKEMTMQEKKAGVYSPFGTVLRDG
jgi:cytochrome c oxidase subunit 4